MIINYNDTILSTSELWEKYGDNALRDSVINELQAFLTPTDTNTIYKEGVFYIGNGTALMLSQASAGHLYSFLAK